MKKITAILMISVLLFSCKKENVQPTTLVITDSARVMNLTVDIRKPMDGCGNGTYNGTIRNPFDNTLSMNVQFDLFENNITYFDVTSGNNSFSGWGTDGSVLFGLSGNYSGTGLIFAHGFWSYKLNWGFSCSTNRLGYSWTQVSSYD